MWPGGMRYVQGFGPKAYAPGALPRFRTPGLVRVAPNSKQQGHVMISCIRRIIQVGSTIAVPSLLCACATTVTKDGVSTAQAQRDIAECQYEAKKASADNPLIAYTIAQDCLKLRGYGLR